MRLQIAFDYLMVFSFVMLVFVLLFSTIAKQRIEFSSEQSFAQLQVIAQVIASDIANAGQAGNGYTATFKLPSELSILAYNVSVTKYGAVIVSTDVFGQTVKAVASGGQYAVVSNSSYLQPPSNSYYKIPTYSGTGSITFQNAFGAVCIDYQCPSSSNQPSQIILSAQQTKVLKLNGLNSYAQGPPIPVKRSVSIWIKTSSSQQQNIFDAGSIGTQGQSFQIGLTQNNGVGGSPPLNTPGVYVAFWADDVYIPNMDLANGAWHNIIVSWNGATQIYVWVDGKLPAGYVWNGAWSALSQQPFTLASVPSPAEVPVFLGHARNPVWDVGSAYLNGSMSNVQIYDTALSTSDSEMLYYKGITGSPVTYNGLVAWWPLAGNGNDYSGNSANLAFFGQSGFPSVSQLRVTSLNSSGSAVSNALVGFSSPLGNFTAGPSTFNLTNGTGVATAFLNQGQSTGIANVRATAFNGNSSTSANVVAWWPMNLGQGSTIYDISPNSNGPSYLSGNMVDASWASPNYVSSFSNGAYVFSSAPNLPTSPPVTIVAWVNPQPSTSMQGVVSWGGPTCGGDVYVLYIQSNNMPMAGVGCPGVRPTDAPELTPNSWNFVAMIINSTGVNFFVNNNNPVFKSATVGNVLSVNFTIGLANYDAGNIKYNGKISNVQVYHSALSTNAIDSLYLAGIGGAPIAFQSLSGWWPLNGNANDYSGNGNNGTEYGNLNMIPYKAKYPTTSHVLSAQFNGQSSYVGIPPSPNIDMTGNVISIGAWVYLKKNNGSLQEVLSNEPTGGGVYLWIDGSNMVHFGYNHGTGEVVSSSGIAEGSWNQLFGVYNGTALKIYINGALSNTISSTSSINALNWTFIGGYGGSAEKATTGFINGSIANVQIYNTSLSTPEIQNLYQGGIAAFPLPGSGLVGWWPLNGDANSYAQPPSVGIPTNIVYPAQSLNAPFITPSVSGSGIFFNGQNSIITNSNNALLNNQPDFSIAGWVYLNNYNANGAECIYSEGIPQTTLGMCVSTYGQLYLNTWNVNTVGNWVIYTSPYIIPLHTWTFVTATLSNGGVNSGTFTLYVNTKSASGSGQEESNSGTHYLGIGANIGSQFGGGQGFSGFNGTIADLQVYNTALNAQQVNQLYNAGIPTSKSINVPLGGYP